MHTLVLKVEKHRQSSTIILLCFETRQSALVLQLFYAIRKQGKVLLNNVFCNFSIIYELNINNKFDKSSLVGKFLKFLVGLIFLKKIFSYIIVIKFIVK